MDNRFTLPIALAVAVHATLLFGFPHAAAPIRTKPDPVKPEKPFPLPPEEIEIVANRDPSEITKGSPDALRPEPEKAERPLLKTDFTVDSTPPSLVPRVDPSQVTWEPGSRDGKKIDFGVLVPAGLLDNPPSARVQGSPDYPDPAKQQGLNGEVWVEFVVDHTGRVHDPVVVRSSARIFEEATLRAVLKWRFEPGKHNGRLVSFRMVVPVVFRLGED
jgi:protein TonB